MEAMFEERSKAFDTRYEDRERYHELAVLHRRITFYSRGLLCATIGLIMLGVGDVARSIIWLMERF